jgi:aminoglycoside phosphotransferase (APT) family kinase protein
VTRGPVDAILARHGVPGPWSALPSTGVANRIYATATVVLRVATDHTEAVADARTESVAAPLAHAAGILTPRLIAFDDSRALVDRPFSLWERVHGETLGLVELDPKQRENVWRDVGRQIARLHTQVHSCTDPNAYLDTPGRELNLQPAVKRLADSGHASGDITSEIERLIDELRPHVSCAAVADCFVHNDLHEMNIMCSREGALLGLIDWGDAGWGDPALDFAAVPLDVISTALEGYGADNVKRLGVCPQARFIWDRLPDALDEAAEHAEFLVPLAAYRRFMER